MKLFTILLVSMILFCGSINTVIAGEIPQAWYYNAPTVTLSGGTNALQSYWIGEVGYNIKNFSTGKALFINAGVGNSFPSKFDATDLTHSNIDRLYFIAGTSFLFTTGTFLEVGLTASMRDFKAGTYGDAQLTHPMEKVINHLYAGVGSYVSGRTLYIMGQINFERGLIGQIGLAF